MFPKLKWILVMLISVLCGFNGLFSLAQEKTAERKVWLQKSDESLQCEPDSGISIDQLKRDFKKRGFKFFELKKIRDSKMRIQLCGSPTGHRNAVYVGSRVAQELMKDGWVFSEKNKGGDSLKIPAH